VVFQVETEPKDCDDDAAGWRLSGVLLLEQRKGDPFGPALHFFVRIDRHGYLIIEDDGRPGMMMRPASAAMLGDEAETAVPGDSDVEIWNDELKFYVYAALLTVSFMHCKNVDTIDVEPSEAMSRKFAKQHGRPLVSYKTLNIEPMRRVLERDGHATQNGLSNALHICRGHFKSFSSSAPLFGKLVGVYWWADQVRGDSSAGVVDKDYRLRVDTDGFGRGYQSADETPPAAPSQPGSNPDLSGRGWVAHNRTQNLLAAAIERAGLTPLSPRPEDPQFDIGWMTDTEVWVCEVKSLTASNEMSQMHTAIGQVIDYTHRLDTGGRSTRKLIAVECEPIADHWTDELAAQSIVLVWADGFDVLFK
jgi:hypothetical protein